MSVLNVGGFLAIFLILEYIRGFIEGRSFIGVFCVGNIFFGV